MPERKHSLTYNYLTWDIVKLIHISVWKNFDPVEKLCRPSVVVIFKKGIYGIRTRKGGLRIELNFCNPVNANIVFEPAIYQQFDMIVQPIQFVAAAKTDNRLFSMLFKNSIAASDITGLSAMGEFIFRAVFAAECLLPHQLSILIYCLILFNNFDIFFRIRSETQLIYS